MPFLNMFLLTYIFAFLFCILTLVLIHEFGHFLAARLFNVKVERFSIGFGKPFYKWKNKKKTEYVIAPILLGGYVKLFDTRETPATTRNQQFAFDRKPLLQRLIIILAGPTTNIIFALLAFWLMFVIGFKLPKPIIGEVIPDSVAAHAKIYRGEEIIKIDQQNTENWEEVIIAMFARIGDIGNLNVTTLSVNKLKTKTHQLNLVNWHINNYRPDPLLDFGMVRYTPFVPPIINKVADHSPAAKSRLQINDRIIAVEDKRISNWQDFIELIKKHPEKPLKLSLERNGKNINLTIIPGWKLGIGWKKVGFLGVSSLPVVWPESMLRKYKFNSWSAFTMAWHKVILFTNLNTITFNKIFTGKISLSILGGPISIFAASGQALGQGLVIFLGFLAMISLSLALVNLLPLPGLDGGYIILLFIEAIIRRPIPIQTQKFILRLGMILFILLIIHVTINDLKRLL